MTNRPPIDLTLQEFVEMDEDALSLIMAEAVSGPIRRRSECELLCSKNVSSSTPRLETLLELDILHEAGKPMTPRQVERRTRLALAENHPRDAAHLNGYRSDLEKRKAVSGRDVGMFIGLLEEVEDK